MVICCFENIHDQPDDLEGLLRKAWACDLWVIFLKLLGLTILQVILRLILSRLKEIQERLQRNEPAFVDLLLPKNW